MFGILKGAVDGGLHIPHSVKNFPGFKEPEERGMVGDTSGIRSRLSQSRHDLYSNDDLNDGRGLL